MNAAVKFVTTVLLCCVNVCLRDIHVIIIYNVHFFLMTFQTWDQHWDEMIWAVRSWLSLCLHQCRYNLVVVVHGRIVDPHKSRGDRIEGLRGGGDHRTSGRITGSPEGAWPFWKTGRPRETSGFRGYKGASKRPPWNDPSNSLQHESSQLNHCTLFAPRGGLEGASKIFVGSLSLTIFYGPLINCAIIRPLVRVGFLAGAGWCFVVVLNLAYWYLWSNTPQALHQSKMNLLFVHKTFIARVHQSCCLRGMGPRSCNFLGKPWEDFLC